MNVKALEKAVRKVTNDRGRYIVPRIDAYCPHALQRNTGGFNLRPLSVVLERTIQVIPRWKTAEATTSRSARGLCIVTLTRTK